MPRIVLATGPSYRKGARAISITGEGQSGQDGSGSSHGRPHRWHHGGVMTPTPSVHGPHRGHPEEPHATHVGGSSMSSIVAAG
jgi:hypothetical protein